MRRATSFYGEAAFHQLGIPSPLISALNTTMGIKRPSVIQERAAKALLEAPRLRYVAIAEAAGMGESGGGEGRGFQVEEGSCETTGDFARNPPAAFEVHTNLSHILL